MPHSHCNKCHTLICNKCHTLTCNKCHTLTCNKCQTLLCNKCNTFTCPTLYKSFKSPFLYCSSCYNFTNNFFPKFSFVLCQIFLYRSLLLVMLCLFRGYIYYCPSSIGPITANLIWCFWQQTQFWWIVASYCVGKKMLHPCAEQRKSFLYKFYYPTRNN